MNERGRMKCAEFNEKEYSNAQLQLSLKRNRMMSLLFHCSAEVDHSTELYYSVNHMYLGSGCFILLLFSEVSPVSEEQENGSDIYGRIYLYSLIEEEVHRYFDGHFTIYTTELDGRLVALLHFHYGLEDAVNVSLYDTLADICKRMSAQVASDYDLQVITYISEIIGELSLITSVYDKMQSLANFHRYINYSFPSTVHYMPTADNAPTDRVLIPVHFSAREIANAVVEGTDYLEKFETALRQLTELPFISIDELKNRCGVLFEEVSNELRFRGLKFSQDKYRKEQVRLNQTSINWQTSIDWYLGFLQEMANSRIDPDQDNMMQRLQNADRFIRENLSNPSLSISDIADAAGISNSTLILLFKNQLNTTPAKHLRSLRMERAIELLKSDLAFEKISSECGFGSIETFYRSFRSEYGLTPGAMRKQLLVE